MAGWNGSDRKGAAPAQPKVTTKKPSPVRGLIAGGVVVALAVLTYFVFFTRSDKPQAEKAAKERGRIKEVTPAAAPKTEEVKTEVPKKLRPQRVGEVRDGYRLLSDGRLHKVKGEILVGAEPTTLVDKTFSCGSDRMIAHLLMAEPGAEMIDDSESIMRGFDKAFEKSLKEKIEIKPEDSDEVRELKQAVLDAREELLAGKAQGKTPEQMMVETRNQMMELSLYRKDLEKEVIRLVGDKEDMSQKDYDELIGAANLMLEERGSKKIEMPKLVSVAMKMSYAHQKAALESRAKELEDKLNKEEQK